MAEEGQKEKIIQTEYWPKPIPIRDFDWTAIDGSTYDGPPCSIGHGATEEQAIKDLLQKLEENDGQ